MATIQVTLDIKEDGQTLPGFPMTQQLTPTETSRLTYSRASGAGFNELALGDLDTITVLMVKPSEAVTLRFNDQTDQGLPVNAGSILLLMNTAIPSGATSKVSLENTSGSAVDIIQVAAGV